MLYHHSSQDYQTAASDAARHARGIMEKKIEEARASAGALLERIHTVVPSDQVVRARRVNFHADDAAYLAFGVEDGDSRPIHRHALAQVAGKAGVPSAYVSELAGGKEGWQRALAAHLLNEHLRRAHADERYLVRSVQGEVRGFLSDRYRRLDSRPLLEAFAGACQEVGAVPVDGTASDVRVAMKAFLPIVFEPIPNEVLCLGIEWGNSDFGAARHSVRAMVWRLWCTNKATLEDTLAQVHLGRQLAEDVELSRRTYELDTRTSVSALRDVVRGVLGPAKVNALLETIKQSAEKELDWKNLKGTLSRKLLKSELKDVEAAYESDDVVNLPEGKSVWRASNAVSWIAGRTQDADRKLELERLAGELVNGKKDHELKEAA